MFLSVQLTNEDMFSSLFHCCFGGKLWRLRSFLIALFLLIVLHAAARDTDRSIRISKMRRPTDHLPVASDVYKASAQWWCSGYAIIKIRTRDLHRTGTLWMSATHLVFGGRLLRVSMQHLLILQPMTSCYTCSSSWPPAAASRCLQHTTQRDCWHNTNNNNQYNRLQQTWRTRFSLQLHVCFQV